MISQLGSKPETLLTLRSNDPDVAPRADDPKPQTQIISHLVTWTLRELRAGAAKLVKDL